MKKRKERKLSTSPFNRLYQMKSVCLFFVGR